MVMPDVDHAQEVILVMGMIADVVSLAVTGPVPQVCNVSTCLTATDVDSAHLARRVTGSHVAHWTDAVLTHVTQECSALVSPLVHISDVVLALQVSLEMEHIVLM